MTEMSGSPRFRLNKEDLKATGKGFLIGLSGLVLTYLTVKAKFVPTEYQPFLWILYATLVNVARKMIAGQPAQPAPYLDLTPQASSQPNIQ